MLYISKGVSTLTMGLINGQLHVEVLYCTLFIVLRGRVNVTVFDLRNNYYCSEMD